MTKERKQLVGVKSKQRKGTQSQTTGLPNKYDSDYFSNIQICLALKKNERMKYKEMSWITFMIRYSDGRPNPVWAVMEAKSPQHAPIKSNLQYILKDQEMIFLGRPPEAYLRPG